MLIDKLRQHLENTIDSCDPVDGFTTISDTDLEEIKDTVEKLAAAVRYWIPDETMVALADNAQWYETVKLLQSVDGKGTE